MVKTRLKALLIKLLPLASQRKKRDTFHRISLFSLVIQLFLSVVNRYNLLALVVAASTANAVCKDRLTALGALYDVGGLLKLPNAGTSFHLSRMRNLSLGNCHC